MNTLTMHRQYCTLVCRLRERETISHLERTSQLTEHADSEEDARNVTIEQVEVLD